MWLVVAVLCSVVVRCLGCVVTVFVHFVDALGVGGCSVLAASVDVLPVLGCLFGLVFSGGIPGCRLEVCRRDAGIPVDQYAKPSG